jgi:plasmid maintenance system antidote protein VapI
MLAVCIFNLGHGKSAYRLIPAVHFNTQTVFVLRLLTHATKIMSGARSITLDHAKRLARRFKMRPEAFLDLD